MRQLESFSLSLVTLFWLLPSTGVAQPLHCHDFLKPEAPVSREVPLEGAEWSATISSLANRYDRIYPELKIAQMDPKLRKLTTRALIAIDLRSGGQELMPDLVLQLRNLLSRFKDQPSLESLSASYIGSVARGDLVEAQREAFILLEHLQNHERKSASTLYGIHAEGAPIWDSLAKEHPAVFERIKVKDVNGKEHELFVLLGHPENATSTLQRFHQLLKSRYGSELYINDDLVPSALGFYQHVGGENEGGPSYIILRTENLKSDFLDFVGFHEGRHVMFKSARMSMQSVSAVEVQVRAKEGRTLPSWYEMDLLVPTAENEALRARHAREKNAYQSFMTFEENYNHVKDLKYANRLNHKTVLREYELHETLPPHRLFDLELVKSKIDLLNEITFKTKNTALEARLFFEKQVRSIQTGLSSIPEQIEVLEGLRREALVLNVNDHYSMNIDFSTAAQREMAESLLREYRRFQETRVPGNKFSPEAIEQIERSLLIELERFQEALSERLIESYDFALEIKIQLANLVDRYRAISTKSGITKEEYLDFRRELFNQGRNAHEVLFREPGLEEPSSPHKP